MPAISQLFVDFRASTDKFNKDLREAQREVRRFDEKMKPTTKLLDGFGEASTKAGVALTASLTAPLLAVAGLGIQFNAMKEQAQIAFTTMLGSGEKATAFLKGLQDFAAKTPFEFPDLVRASQRLMAMGFAADKVRPLLTSVGDAVAGLGGGAAEIDRVTLALGQMQGRGKVATQEMNQLTEVGIPAWKILADAIGVSEMKLRDMVEKGAVPAGAAVNALVDGMNAKFGGMMAKQATTFTGLISTIKDESKFLAGELTTGLFNVIKGPLENTAKILHDLRESMKGWSDGQKAALTATGLLAAAIGPLLIALGATSMAVSSMITLYGQLGGASVILAGASKVLNAALNAIPFVLVATAVVSLIALFVKLRETWINNAEAAKQVSDAQSRQFLLVERSISNLKALGIEVDRTGKSQEQLEQHVRNLTQSYYKEHPAVKAVTDAHKKNELQIAAEAEAYRKSAEEAKKAEDAQFRLNRQIYEAGEFWKKVEQDNSEALREMSSNFKESEKDFKAWVDVQQELRLRMLGRIRDAEIQSIREVSAGLKGQADAAMAGLTARTKQEIATAELVDEIWDESFDANVERINSGTKEQQKAAESYQRIWEQATANVTSGLVKGLSDVIFHAKNFGQAMKDIALNTAESMFQAFLTGLLSPLTSAMSRLGQKLGSILMGGAGGGGILGKLGGLIGLGGTAAGTASASAGVGAAGAGAGVGLGGAGSAMAAFATNPITIGIAAAIGAGLIAKHYIGKGRRTANEFVGNAERPFGQQLGAIVDSFDSMKKAGTLTLEQAKTARDSAQELWRSFLQSNAEFAAQGKTQAKVAEQSLENLKQAFGPNLQKVFEGMDSTIAGLQGAGGSGIAATGLASSASTRFAAAVDRLVPAFDTLIETITGIGPRGGAQLTINNEFAPAFTFYGVPESLQQQIRDQIEPQIISDLQDNTRGITQQVKDALGL